MKKQRDALKQFRRYLPTLQLKKQQLQMKILEARKVLSDRERVMNENAQSIEQWCGVMGEQGVGFEEWIKPKEIITGKMNIAGANVPVFKEVIFNLAEYDYYSTPFWVDKGIEILRMYISSKVEVEIVKKQISILQKELRTTTQRVNLFEKIKIPECLDNIRKIGIYLGDQQANAVGVSKVAKRKVDAKNLETALV